MKNTVSLGQGIPSFSTPKYITESAIELLRNNSNIGKYSLQPGLPELKKTVANKIESSCTNRKITINPETEIFISAGAIEAIAAGVCSFVNPKDEVVLFDPTYPSFIEQVTFAGGKLVYIKCPEKNNWRPELKSIKKAITQKTKLIIIASPSNPTGAILGEKEMQEIVKLALKYNVFIIADETYSDLVYDNIKYKSFLDYNQIKNQLILCSSFSKAYAMTGWRVGYMYAPEHVINQVLKVHDAFLICAPTISQYAALAALTKDDRGWLKKMKKEMNKRKNLICKRLDRLPGLFSYQKPQGAFYILAKYKKTNLNSQDFAVKLLNETGVITIPGGSFGKESENCLRLSYGGDEEVINEAFDRIEKWNKILK